MTFPCVECGLCCQRVGHLPLPSDDEGVCLNYDRASKRCLIYEERPLICRVEESGPKGLAQFTWYRLNIDACERLDKEKKGS